ncbi:isochorismate synthase [Numidum massiliense]|uniref:isochorismate synthase n=1 Tax=Numidum massiliense TaxID=1522315 RepID=UPI0006D576BE|nr:isochorismate synthase [Numidum massiliense]
MAIVKQLDLCELLVEGARRAQQLGREVLVSRTVNVATVDPLSFFVAASSDRGSRVYFTDPAQEVVLVGIGKAYEIEANGEERFSDVEREWGRLVAEAVVELPEDTVTAIGPLLLGGFSFDPERHKTALWHGFPDAAFHLPTFLLTRTAGQCWLTVNEVVHAATDANARADALRAQQAELLDAVGKGTYLPLYEADGDPTYASKEIEPEKWKDAVAEAARDIRAGRMDKVVLARELRLTADREIAVERVLERLSQQQPNSFVFAVERGEQCFVGATPERLVKREGDTFFTMSMAGSIARGETAAEDTRLGNQLLQDEKNRIEHGLVVDMIRRAMATACDGVDVPAVPELLKVKYIQHLYTPIFGRARAGATLLSLVEKLHPTPAVGGYPHESFANIRELECLDRGWYAAPLGWLDWRGNGDFAVALRSGLIRGNEASLFAGCGIVGASDPQSEYEETRLKFRPMLQALGLGGTDE